MKNQSRSIDIRLESYLKVGIASFLIAIFGAAVLTATSWFVLAPFWVLIVILAHLPHYRLHIDRERKFFTEYFYFFGRRKGTPVPYQEIKYIFIRANRVSSGTVYSMVRTVPISMGDPYRDTVFDAFIVFDGNRKVKLMRKDFKEVVLAEVKKLAHTLEVRVSDQTGEKPVWVE